MTNNTDIKHWFVHDDNGKTVSLAELKSKIEIDLLKRQIEETDYKVIKCHEYALVGKPLPYDIEAIHAERQAIRDRINKLQTETEGSEAK